MNTPLTDLVLEPGRGDSLAPGKGGSLVARQVSAWFGRTQVLDEVSMDIPAGRVVSIIGPSGCGKSTFLRVLNRMHELAPKAALAGEVLLDGTDVYGPGVLPAQTRLRIGMVFQRPNPFPNLSVRGNVLSGLRLAGIRCPDPDTLVERCLRQAGLWGEVKDRLGVSGAALSGGQQQRLCIAPAWRWSPACCSWTSPALPSTPPPPAGSRPPSGSCRGT
jgi:phosphate transport system ATP-binding protein